MSLEDNNSKVRDQDLKNMLNSKLKEYFSRGGSNLTRHAALGLKTRESELQASHGAPQAA